MEERVEMLKEATKHIPNVRVTCFSGLLNEFCKKEEAPFIVRGLRAFTDFEYEFQRALLLKKSIMIWKQFYYDQCQIFLRQLLRCARAGNLWRSAEGFGT